jgi:MFS transporter, MCT family, solute carrier family 16 (monocarboxylic acid transporters), member 10
MIGSSGLICVFSLMMLSITKPQQIYQQYLTQTVLFSIGSTTGYFAVLGIVPHWFREKLGIAMGIAAASPAIGGIIWPIMLRRLIKSVGFGWAVRCMAFVSLFSFAIGFVLISPRRPKRPLPPLKNLLAFEAFKDMRFTVLAIGSWLTVFVLFNPMFFIGLYAITANGSSPMTPYFVTIVATGSIIGRLLPGFVKNWPGPFNGVCLAAYLCGLFMLALWYPSTKEPNLIAFALLYGMLSGPVFSLLPVSLETSRTVTYERDLLILGFLFCRRV